MATGATILSTTLPTVVSMGVTSRAIDTTLGRQSRGRRAKSRGKGKTVRVYQGKRGGTYVKKNGRKIYV